MFIIRGEYLFLAFLITFSIIYFIKRDDGYDEEEF